MQSSVSDPLAALRDIHLPAPVPFWPPAPGWWIAAGLLLATALGVLIVRRVRHSRHESWNEAAARELAQIEARFAEKGDGADLAADLSSLLRRTALARYPEKGIAALHGDPWFGLLCQDPAGESSRSPRVAIELTRAAYQGDLVTEGNPREWIEFAHSWIEEAA